MLPLLLLGVARGITAGIDLVRSAAGLRQRRAVEPLMVALIAIGLLAMSIAPLHGWYDQIRQPWRELTAFLQTQILPGEVLLVEPPWYVEPLAYYGLTSAYAIQGSVQRFRKQAGQATGVWYLRSAHARVDPTGEIRRLIEAEGYTKLWDNKQSIGWMSLYYKHQAESGSRDLVPVLANLEQVDPADAEIHDLLAGEYRQRGQFAAARAEYEQARQIEPDNPHWLVLLGQAWVEEGAPERGLDLVQQGVALAPDNASFWAVLGDVHQQMGQPELALQGYQRASELSPQNAGYLVKMGQIHTQLQAIEEARDQYQQAVELAPGNAWYHLLLANALLALDKPEQALDEYDQVLALNPDYQQNTWYLLQRGHACRLAGRTEEAIAAYEQVLALDGGNAQANKWLHELE
jgi:tetratricopeptide (TPR) repeat protein